MENHTWYPSITAPSGIPMRVVDARLLLTDGTVMRIPEGKILCHTWGRPVTVFILGESDAFPLPERLIILYFSYWENCFFEGKLDLPVNEMTEIWNEGVLDSMRSSKAHYESIVIGVAPEGIIQIWFFGHGVSRSVFLGSLTKSEYAWEKFIDDPGINRAQYVTSVLQDKFGKEKFESLKQDRKFLSDWGKRNNKFQWDIHVVSQLKIESTWIDYINGEREFILWENDFRNFNLRAVPNALQIKFVTDNGKRHSMAVEIDPASFEAALKLFTEKGDADKLFLVVQIPAFKKETFICLSSDIFYHQIVVRKVKFYTLG
jgi:hypothetical protein